MHEMVTRIYRKTAEKASGPGFQKIYFSVCWSNWQILQFLCSKDVTYTFLYFWMQVLFSCILKFSRIFVCLKIVFACNVCCTYMWVSTSAPNPDFFCSFITFERFRATFFVYIWCGCSVVRHNSYMVEVLSLHWINAPYWVAFSTHIK